MKKFIEQLRLIILVLLVIVATVFGGIKLMRLQIVDGSEYLEQSKTVSIATQTIPASRGEIVDAKGKPIVQNKVGFNVIIEKAFFPSDSQEGNEVLIRTVRLLNRQSLSWIDTIPITFEQPYEFTVPEDDNSVTKLKELIGVNVYATAEDCIDKLIDDYEISNEYSAMEQRIIAGIRYEMLLNNFSVSNRYTLAEDINMDTVTKLKELGLELKGIDTVEEAIRTYAQTNIIPHEIGTVGPIYAEEYAELKDEGYALNDTLGKSGLEKNMEKYLRGKNGTKEYSFVNGAVESAKVTQEPVAGNTIQLTIDSEFQLQVQSILENFIYYLQRRGGYGNVSSGAIVVLNAKTGAVLALATCPTYDLKDYKENYSELLQRPNEPLIDRATDGLYRPGSAFKTITATAGLNEGIVNGYSTFYCAHRYQYFDINVGCTGTHHNIAVSRALTVSCNIYFYELAQRIGVYTLSDYAKKYGFGQSLGLECGDSAGHLPTPETCEELGIPWTPGLVLQYGIGQSELAVTPLQMATAAMTIANKGVRYKPYLVDCIYDYSMENVIQKTEPTIADKIDLNYNYVYDFIEQGMIGAAQNTPAGEYSLNNLGYQVAIKTGTPQSGRGTDSTFIGYAPVGDPEIAFAAVIEGGEYSKYMVRKILDSYYSLKNSATQITDNQTVTNP